MFETPVLGAYSLNDFDVLCATGEHSTRGVGTLYELSRYFEKTGRPLPVSGDEIHDRYLKSSGEGYYFHAFGPGSDNDGKNVNRKLLHAVVLGCDTETKKGYC